jgi:hypothetical protein
MQMRHARRGAENDEMNRGRTFHFMACGAEVRDGRSDTRRTNETAKNPAAFSYHYWLFEGANVLELDSKSSVSDAQKKCI